MKAHELIRALRLPPDQRRSLRQALRSLETQGKIERMRKNRWAVPRAADTPLTGVLTVQPSGVGFVTFDGQDEDIFIPPRQMGVALHGDRVEVTISRSRSGHQRRRRRGASVADADDERRLTGRIIAVRERRFTRLAGVLKVTPHYRYVIPDHPRIQANVHVQAVAKGIKPLQDGCRVVMELLEWTTPGTPAPGRVVENLGPADAPGSDMLGLLHSHGLEAAFPKPVEKEVARWRAVDSAKGAKVLERRDLRQRCLITIDPEDARDFDDAVSLRRTADGNWELGVHIADVSAYVEPGSTVDQEARRRGTSVYLVDRVITMLPRHLTEAVCSLAPEVDRLAHTVDITLSPRGRVLNVDTYPSLIRSTARLDYDTVQAVLDDQSPEPKVVTEPVQAMLREMQALAQRLRRKRARRGSILFVMPEVRCVLDAQGQPTAIVPRSSYAAYQLIEEFMLLANQVVARRIADAGYPCIYRIHPPPDEKQWDQMAADLAALDHSLPSMDRAGMNAVAAAVRGKPGAHVVHLAMLRNLKRALYTAERADHFGLAFDHYVHFTSPIRRFPDLIAHRVLNAVEQGTPPPYSEKNLATMAAHCSDMERQAAEAEQESVDLKRMAYYAQLLKTGATGPFQALVTGVIGRGLLVELTDTLQRGLVPFALLRHDFDSGPRRSRGRRRPRRPQWQMGDTLDVELIRVDEGRKWVDFSPYRNKRTSNK